MTVAPRRVARTVSPARRIPPTELTNGKTPIGMASLSGQGAIPIHSRHPVQRRHPIHWRHPTQYSPQSLGPTPHHPPVPRVASVRPPRTISPALSTQPSRRLSSLGMAPENRGRSSGRSPDHVRRSRTAIMTQTAFAAHASHFLPTHRKSRPSNLLHAHDNLPQICGETLFGCLNDDLMTTRRWPSGGSTVALR